MTANNQSKKKGSAQSGQKKKRKFPLIVALLVGACLIIVVWGVLNSKKPGTKSPTPPADTQSADSENVSSDKKRDFLNLTGRWIRTDGGYVIEIRNVATDGKMDAGYYNPRPINVSMAEASWSGTGTKIFIELQDAGYPGSTYTLTYEPDKDMLVGIYYQAAMQQNFDVVFARMK
jgi:hypothetical protein